MPDDPALVRQWRLIKILSGSRQGATVRELAEEMRVAEKTIRRDLQTFVGVGFPLEETPGEHGRKSWRMKPGHGQPELNFALDEALALYLGRRFFEPLAGTYFWEAAQNAFRKIQACLGKSALGYLQQMAGSLYQTAIGSSDYSQKAELIDQLMRGIEETKATHIVYRSLQATEAVTYEVYPLGLAFHKGSLYLVADSHDHGERRHFKVDRIEEAEVGPFPFERPGDFNLADHLADSFGIFHGEGEILVKVKFLPAVARYVQESKWHASQQLSPKIDGSLLAEFRLSSTEEIMRWLMGFGPYAVVVQPDALREEIASLLREMLANYGSAAAGDDNLKSHDRRKLKTRSEPLL